MASAWLVTMSTTLCCASSSSCELLKLPQELERFRSGRRISSSSYSRSIGQQPHNNNNNNDDDDGDGDDDDNNTTSNQQQPRPHRQKK